MQEILLSTHLPVKKSVLDFPFIKKLINNESQLFKFE